ncbi:hypothetical protein ACHAXS_005725 [Conticribra weissflogii]
MKRKELVAQLIRSARGLSPATSTTTYNVPNNSLNSKWDLLPSSRLINLPLPCFPLEQRHFGRFGRSGVKNSDGCASVSSPSDFHSHLCYKIRNAQERVVLASLYIGVGSGAAEDEFLDALQAASSRNLKKIQVILDANRAMRKVSLTKTSNSKKSEGSLNDKGNSGLFLFPVHDKRLSTILPSPLDEVAGVFHIKAYIIDDELILSGANLSEEYFSNRIDRYMSFVNGGGLVEFYVDLCDILSTYAIKYDGETVKDATSSSIFETKNEEDRKRTLEQSLKQLFYEGNNIIEHEYDRTVVAYAIPTFQVSNRFFRGRSLPFPSDQEATYSLIRTVVENDPSASIRLSSAYLNLTRNMLSALTTLGVPFILTAGLTSHGFAPKERVKASIPEAFLTLVKDAALPIRASDGKVLMYERPEWTFHAKGIWITSHCNTDGCSECDNKYNNTTRELISDPSSLVSTIIGSSNYGARSYDLDVESNCILIFSESSDKNDEVLRHDGASVRDLVAAEWNNLCKYCNELNHYDHDTNISNIQKVIVHFMKRFL